MPSAQIIDIVNFMPERVVRNSEIAAEVDVELADNEFFRGVRERRFASPDYSSAQLGARALSRLLERTGVAADDLDLILCSCIFSDVYWPGIAPEVQHLVGARRATIANLDTSCSSYLSMLNAARAYVESGMYRKVAVVTSTNFVSRLPEMQRSRKSWVLGDGASATLVAPGESSFLGHFERSHGEHYGLFVFQPDAVDGQQRPYWERGCGPITVNFSADMVTRIRTNAIELVPQAVHACLDRAHLRTDDIDLLVTHQPNEFFIDQWRERIGIQGERTHDTLSIYGNLFQGSIPVTLADALERGKLRSGDVAALGTFSNGGDFVSALALRWH